MELWSRDWNNGEAHSRTLCRRPTRPRRRRGLRRQRQPAPGLARRAAGHRVAGADLPRLRRAQRRRRRQQDRPRGAGRPAARGLLPLGAGRPAAGACARSPRASSAAASRRKGKPGPASLRGTRQGLNDYTGWFAGDPAMAGSYFGYDGPFPPFNDSLVHHYVFTLYAVAVPRLPVEGDLHRRTGARSPGRAGARRGNAVGDLHAQPPPDRQVSRR